jgi:hypothetical protein
MRGDEKPIAGLNQYQVKHAIALQHKDIRA